MLSRAVEMENLDKIEVCFKVESSFLRIGLRLSTSPSSPFFSFFNCIVFVAAHGLS